MNVESLGSALGEIEQLHPVSYDLIPEANLSHLGRQIGLIAQEVMRVDPRLAAVYQSGPQKDTPSSVRYQQLTALLVKGMQEQQREIRREQGEIYALAVWCFGLSAAFVIRRRR